MSTVKEAAVCKAGWMSDCSEHVVKRVKEVRGCWLITDLIYGFFDQEARPHEMGC